MTQLVQFAVIGLCMLGAAFYAGIETGIISIHRVRLRHFVRRGLSGTRDLQNFLEHPDRLLGTTLVGTNICVVVTSVVAASLAVQWLGAGVGEAVSTVLVSALVLVFCEYLPKSWFRHHPVSRCRRFAGLLRASEVVLRPVSVLVVWLTRWMVPGASGGFAKPMPFVTREDLKILAHEGERDGMLSQRERVMIHRVFELSGKTARDIMTPRAEMETVAKDTPIPEFLDTVRRRGRTRMAVLDPERGRFVGIINFFYVVSTHPLSERSTVADFARPPLFIRDDMPVDDIFPRLRRSRQPMCLVQDSNEEVIGLITSEDILEEIVGEL